MLVCCHDTRLVSICVNIYIYKYSFPIEREREWTSNNASLSLWWSWSWTLTTLMTICTHTVGMVKWDHFFVLIMVTAIFEHVLQPSSSWLNFHKIQSQTWPPKRRKLVSQPLSFWWKKRSYFKYNWNWLNFYVIILARGLFRSSSRYNSPVAGMVEPRPQTTPPEVWWVSCTSLGRSSFCFNKNAFFQVPCSTSPGYIPDPDDLHCSPPPVPQPSRLRHQVHPAMVRFRWHWRISWRHRRSMADCLMTVLDGYS